MIWAHTMRFKQHPVLAKYTNPVLVFDKQPTQRAAYVSLRPSLLLPGGILVGFIIAAVAVITLAGAKAPGPETLQTVSVATLPGRSTVGITCKPVAYPSPVCVCVCGL